MKVRSIVASLTFVAACAAAPSAPADTSMETDSALLHACIAAANADPAALANCRGVVARACLEAAGSGTMQDVLCWDGEAVAWDEAIAAATERMNARMSYRDPQRLAAANAAWSAWADAECEYWAWEEGGGSGEQVDRVRCAARVKADRAIDLIVASVR